MLLLLIKNVLHVLFNGKKTTVCNFWPQPTRAMGVFLALSMLGGLSCVTNVTGRD